MRFVIFSDTKGKDNGINKKVLTKLLTETAKLNPEPDLIVLGGDNVAGSEDTSILTAQLQYLKNLIDSHCPGIPLIPVIGNHEVNNNPMDSRYEVIFNKSYGDSLPSTALEGYNKTVFYIDYGDTRYIVLNAFHFGEIQKITQKQLLWFLEAASVDIRNKLVFVHSPAFPTGAHFGHCLDLYPECRDTFWRIAEDCNIDIIFSGHEHNYSTRKIGYTRQVYQVISGGGGEKLKNKLKSKKGLMTGPIAKYHFVIVDITSNGMVVTAVNCDGKAIDKLTIDKCTNCGNSH